MICRHKYGCNNPLVKEETDPSVYWSLLCQLSPILLISVILFAGMAPMDGSTMHMPPGPPPQVASDPTSDHPDHYIPEAVRSFLPYFYQKFKEKVFILHNRCYTVLCRNV